MSLFSRKPQGRRIAGRMNEKPATEKPTKESKAKAKNNLSAETKAVERKLSYELPSPNASTKYNYIPLPKEQV